MTSMTIQRLSALAAAAAVGLLLAAHPEGHPLQEPAPPPAAGDRQESFRFRTGVELINVTATVTDQSGHFVPNLQQEDFRVYQDNELQPITHFNSERVPVSLGIALDISGSMDGEKMAAARDALGRFLSQLLEPDDEVFLYTFDSAATLVEGWTTDKRRVSLDLRRLEPRGGTAMYDAVAEAIPLARTGHNRKKALVIISDGNDTSSRTDVLAVKRLIRESEVLVYAVGIDSQGESGYFPIGQGGVRRPRPQPPRMPFPFPFPMPGGRRPAPPPTGPSYPPAPRGGYGTPNDDHVNVAALREITDDSGGRTEIIRSPRDLDPATAGIADELSRQYYLGYAATGVKDGQWHPIRVELRNPGYRVRARRGFIATP
ncbi:MAG: VWA domain-containing protein [Acidobacteriota bacterium]